MIRYCAGLMFNQRRDRVVLIEKNRGPEVNIGRWNALGGKIEDGETAHEAMVREFREESGLHTLSWNSFAETTAVDYSYHIHWFRCTVSNSNIYMVKSKESEPVAVCHMDRLHERPLAENLEAMLALALTPTIQFSNLRV